MINRASIQQYFSFDDDLLRRVMLLFFLLCPVFLLVSRSLLDIAISAIAVSFLIYSFYWQDFSWLKLRWVQAALVFWLYMLLNSIQAYDSKLALSQALPFIRFPIFAVAVAVWVVKSPAELKWFIAIFALTLLYSMADGYFEYIFGFDFGGNAKSGGRLSGPFERSTLGIYLTKGGLPICVAIFGLLHLNRHDNLFGQDARTLFTLTAVATALIVVLIILAGERMAILLMLFALFILAWQLKTIRKYLISLIVLMMVSLGAVISFDSSMKERLYTQTLSEFQSDRTGAFSYRELFQLSGKLIKDHPIFGVGPHNYRYICSDEKYLPNHPREFTCLIHPHNVYLELWVNNGIIGVLIFLAMVFFWFQMIIRNYRQSGEARFFLLSGTLAAILFLWPFSVGMSIFSNFNGSFFWMMIAYMLASFQLFAPDDKIAEQRGG